MLYNGITCSRWINGIGLLMNEKQNQSNNINIYNNKIIDNTEQKLVTNQFKQINQNPENYIKIYNRELMRDTNKDFIYSKLSGQPRKTNLNIICNLWWINQTKYHTKRLTSLLENYNGLKH